MRLCRTSLILFAVLLHILLFSGCPAPTSSLGDATDAVEQGVQYEAITLFSDATGVTMTNAASTGTEPASNITRTYLDLTRYSHIRGQFVSSLTSNLILCKIEYSIDNGGNWLTLVPAFEASTTANGMSVSADADIPAAAQGPVLIRAVIFGNGVLDPVIRSIRIELF